MENILPGKKLRPVVLVVLDGWGIGEKNHSNALSEANLPTFKTLDDYYPKIALQASGISVGLPWGEPGNSEVGHMTLGAGKVIYQDMPRITMAIQDGTFYKNEVFLGAFEHAKKNGSALHLMGLVGRGSVHSHIDHLYALLEMAKYQKVQKVFVHVFTDGRDSAPTSAIESIKELEIRMEKYGVGKIASVMGRYWSMDRNTNWDRTQKAYDTLIGKGGEKIENIEKYLRDSYKKGMLDEFIEPGWVFDGKKAVGEISDKDSVIFFNFREDRARQITDVFCSPDFSHFPSLKFNDLYFASMTQYGNGYGAKIAFPPIKIEGSLGKLLSEKNLKQLRIAETEKFAHVTYFFNGGKEDPFAGEDRIIVPSKNVPGFDQAPEMSALEITEKVEKNVESGIYDFILVNYANADMVGHTGNKPAAIKAVEAVDKNLESLIRSVLTEEGCLLITADHGNVEEMVNSHTGEKDTEHSANPVPLWFVSPTNHKKKSASSGNSEVPIAGLLSDVAPTVLDILEIPKPEDMTGESLLEILK